MQQGMKKSDDKSESAGDGLLATYLVRVKEEVYSSSGCTCVCVCGWVGGWVGGGCGCGFVCDVVEH